MSLLDDIKKDRADIKVPTRRAIGETASKTDRNKDICRRYWEGGITHKELAEEYDITRKAVQQMIQLTNAKLKKYHLTREHYLNT